MCLYEFKYRVNNGYCCFDRRVIVLAEQLDAAKERAISILKERCGGAKATYSLLDYKKHDNAWVEPD